MTETLVITEVGTSNERTRSMPDIIVEEEASFCLLKLALAQGRNKETNPGTCMGDSWQQRAPVSRNFKALLDKKNTTTKKYHNFSIVLRQRKGARDMTGENVPTSCSPPPQFSIFCGWQQGQSPGNWILSLKWLSILWVKCFQMPLKNLPDHTKDKMR